MAGDEESRQINLRLHQIDGDVGVTTTEIARPLEAPAVGRDLHYEGILGTAAIIRLDRVDEGKVRCRVRPADDVGGSGIVHRNSQAVVAARAAQVAGIDKRLTVAREFRDEDVAISQLGAR